MSDDQVLPDYVHRISDEIFRNEEKRLREEYNAAALAWVNHVHRLPKDFQWVVHPDVIGQVAWMCTRCNRIERNFDRSPWCGCTP